MHELIFLGTLADFFSHVSVFSEKFLPDSEARYDADFLIWCDTMQG